MNVHVLKTHQPYFHQLYYGDKKFELRKDDRGFSIGDILVLEEYDQKVGAYTGKRCQKTVTSILHGHEATQWGLNEGFCIMSLEDNFSEIDLTIYKS